MVGAASSSGTPNRPEGIRTPGDTLASRALQLGLSHSLGGRVGGLIAAIYLAGCVSGAMSHTGDVPAGHRPGIISVTLTSEIRSRPYSPETLSRPDVTAAIAMCEQMFGSEGHCRIDTTPGAELDRFTREEHERVYVFVVLRDLQPGRLYEVSSRWFGPDGGVTARASKRLTVPDSAKPSLSLDLQFWSALRTMRPGRWRVEIAVNGEVEADRTFEVIGSTRAQGPPRQPLGRAP